MPNFWKKNGTCTYVSAVIKEADAGIECTCTENNYYSARQSARRGHVFHTFYRKRFVYLVAMITLQHAHDIY